MANAKALWAKFWSWPWKAKGPVIAVASLFLLSIIGAASGGGAEEDLTKADADDVTAEATSAANPTDQPKPTDEPKATAVVATQAATQPPTQAATATVPPEPTATTVPLTTEEQFAKSFRDNKGFMPLAADDDLKVTWEPIAGLLTFEIYRGDKNTSTGATLHTGGSTALIANRAIWTTYPAVNEITVQMWEKAINTSTGQQLDLVATRITTTRETASRFDYDGLKSLQISDNKRFFCSADSYQFAPHIYADIGDKGCLATWGIRK